MLNKNLEFNLVRLSPKTQS